MNSAIELDHPFQRWFESLGQIPQAHAELVNRDACNELMRALYGPVEKPGRCILLRAPRAGHGKSHLLTRVQHGLSNSHEFIPIQAGYHCRVDASSLLDDTIRRLSRPLPAAGGLCVLDLIVRRIFAYSLQPLVASGEVPCQDRESALAALRTRPIETFDFHHPNAVTAHWAAENFYALSQRLSHEIAARCHMPLGMVAFWVSALFQFANTSLADSSRFDDLTKNIHAAKSGDASEMDRVQALLSMTCLVTRVVLVADDVEAFSTDENAAMRFAAFLGSLRQAVPQLEVILSVNQDIWESAFLPRLSGGLADRLSEIVIELKPLSEEEIIALLESRAPGLGAVVLPHIDLKQSGTHARGLLQAAGVAWALARSQLHAPVQAEVEPEPEAPPVFLEETSQPVPSDEEMPSAETFAEPLEDEPQPRTQLVDDYLDEQPTTQPEHPSPSPEVKDISADQPTAAPPNQEDSERVDELLRQFRDRYGRSTL